MDSDPRSPMVVLPTGIDPCDNITQASDYLIDFKVGRTFREPQAPGWLKVITAVSENVGINLP